VTSAKGEEACGDLEAIDFDKPDELTTVKVGSIIVATGFDMYDVERKEEWGYKVFDNVVTGIEMERLISASGPTGGNIVRPSDGQKPKSVGFVLCAGSRDQDEEDGAKPYCSRVCCMYSLKHAHQLIEKIPGCVPYLFYMDIRSFERRTRSSTTAFRTKAASSFEVASRGSPKILSRRTLQSRLRTRF